MKSEGFHLELKVPCQHGWTISQYAREFGLTWHAVKREVTSENAWHCPERTQPTMLTIAKQTHGARRLAVCPTIRGTRLHHELRRDHGYIGGYPSFARGFEVLRPQ